MISSKSPSRDSRLAAFHTKALCTVLVKLANQDLERRLKKNGIRINLAALMVLRVLRHAPRTIQDVSVRLVVAPATLIPIIDELEQEGLVRRGTDASDRRKTPLSITPEGTGLLADSSQAAKSSLIVAGMGRLGARKSAQLIALLEELTASVAGDDAVCKTIKETVTQAVDGKPADRAGRV